MKLDRRSFLQFTAGAVAGTLLSPLPWKLADDTAIWSQNWRWRPKSEPGETSYAYSICRLCPGGCGIKVRLIDDKRGVFVSGNSNDPVNKGGICPLGIASLQFLYAPYRLGEPMKQTGKRGDPKGFKPISWDEALENVSERMEELVSKGEASTVAWINGDSKGSMKEFINYFLDVYGTSNYFCLPCSDDSQELANFAMRGAKTPTGFDLERAEFIVSFGADLLGGWGAPIRVHKAFSDWVKTGPGSTKSEIIQIDWRESYTASKANEWIAILPGTEAALALGMCHVIIRDKLYDKNFVDELSFGFEDWTDERGRTHQGFKRFILKKYPPGKVAEITGIKTEKIVSLARKFASKKPALAVWGGGNNRVPGTLYHDMVFMALNALVGNLGKPGGVFNVANPPLAPWPHSDLSGKNSQAIEKGATLGVSSENKFPLRGNLFYTALDEIVRGGPARFKLLFLYEANPAYSIPEHGIYQKALNKIDFVVSFSSYLDETAMLSDIILPNHTFLERWDDMFTPEGCPFSVYGISKPVLSPQKNTRHTGDVLLALAKKLGSDFAEHFPWKDYQTLLKSRLSGIIESGKGKVVAGEDITQLMGIHGNLEPNFGTVDELWEKLTSGKFWVSLPDYGEPFSFKTPSGKFEFYTQKLKIENENEKKDEFFLPHFFPLEPSGSPKDYPYSLISYGLFDFLGAEVANPPFLKKLLSDSLLKGNDLFVQMNPSTAVKAKLKEGNRVQVETPVGKAKFLVHLTEEIPPKVLAVPTGFGHWAFDKYIRSKGVNVNRLVEVQLDPTTGMGTWWLTRAKVKNIEI